MISSRRLAREWALKILYQSDVGKISIEESVAVALERLRREFVQRGSRAAAGSLLEEYVLDAITSHLSDLVPGMHAALDLALRDCIAGLLTPTEYWRRLDVHFMFSRQSFRALLDTPRIGEPLALPSEVAALPPAVIQSPRLTDVERPRLLKFLNWGRTELPRICLAAFTREVQIGRPEKASLKVTQAYVEERWATFTHSMSDRWSGLGSVVLKPTSDWMRVASFATKLVSGTYQHRDALDTELQLLTTSWAVDRQASVDRNILRIAAYEMIYLEGIPASATINEAVELAKKYSTSESGRFVNGILGAMAIARGDALNTDRLDPGGMADEIGDTEIGAEIEIEEIPDGEELAQV